MNTTTYTEAAAALAAKFRKGATSSFGAKEFATVIEPFGFTVEQVKVGRKVESVIFTAPNGDTLTEGKSSPTQIRVSFYRTFNWLESHGVVAMVSAALGLQTPEEEATEKKMYGVQYDLNNAGTCSCCFRIQKLDDAGTLVSHGYERPGHGFIVGGCFGVGRLPLEVSVSGAAILLHEHLEPSAKTAEYLLSDLQTAPPASITQRVRSMRKGVEDSFVVYTAADGFRYSDALATMVRKAEADATCLRKKAEAFRVLEANWAPDIAPIERKAARQPAVMTRWIAACIS